MRPHPKSCPLLWGGRCLHAYNEGGRQLTGLIGRAVLHLAGSFRYAVQLYLLLLTVGRPDELEAVGVGLCEALDDVDLHERHLHGVHVLRPARRVRHPQLQREEGSEIAKTWIVISELGAVHK